MVQVAEAESAPPPLPPRKTALMPKRSTSSTISFTAEKIDIKQPIHKPHAPPGPAPIVRQPFMRRRAYPPGVAATRPTVLTNYSAGLRYILTDDEVKLLIRVQANSRGLALRAQLRRWWTAEWQACFYERQLRLWRRLYIVSIVVGSIQVKRQRYIRRKRRQIRNTAQKLAEAEEEEEDSKPEGLYPPWFSYVAWACIITWCVPACLRACVRAWYTIRYDTIRYGRPLRVLARALVVCM